MTMSGHWSFKMQPLRDLVLSFLATTTSLITVVSSTTRSKRQLNPLSALPSLVIDLVPQIIDITDQGTAECQFTEKTRELITLQFLDKNVLIYSAVDAKVDGLENAYCFPVSLNIALGIKKTYNVCAFDQGRFNTIDDVEQRLKKPGLEMLKQYSLTDTTLKTNPTVVTRPARAH
ncbi:hypothetical protein QBC38DRAFT_540772 [Podospora fimiseda]|uniref:Uncharacterized protein n=1 Tax=Podospora fimiseda TaxID=252190 RepID=A0AAN7H8D7_9PEZI|nr:hypothetical protein QBC38DRAFT_540772 [Podospora fimiseda]